MLPPNRAPRRRARLLGALVHSAAALAAAAAACRAPGQPRPAVLAPATGVGPAVDHRAHPAAGAAGPALAEPTMGVHGMLVAGLARRGECGGCVLLSHLPLYRAPHDRQLLLVARLAADAPAADRALAGIPAAGGDGAAADTGLWTFEPERAPLAAIAAATPARPVRLRGTLYRGHFERGGTPAARPVVMEVRHVAFARTLASPAAAAAAPGASTHVLVCAGGAAYVVHRVGGAPDFDQVAALAPTPPACAAPAGGPADAPAALDATLDGRASSRERPLRDGEAVVVRTAAGPFAGVVRSLYLEFDDLRAAAP